MKTPFNKVPIEEVKKYWDNRPCNIRHSTSQVGTRQYFDEVEKNRIKDFIREAWLKKTKKIFAEWQEHFDDVYNDLIKNLH